MLRLRAISLLIIVATLTASCAGARQASSTATPVPTQGAPTTQPAPTGAPSGTLVPAALSVQPASPLAEPFPPADPFDPDASPIVEAWDFTRGTQGWSPTNDLARFERGADGIVTRAIGGDPYMFGPSISVAAETAPYLEIRMRSTQGKHAQVFWEVEGRPFNETDSYHFDVEEDGAWQTYLLPLKDSDAWRGQITRLRLDPSNTEGGEITVASMRLLGPAPGRLALERLGTPRAFVWVDEAFEIGATVRNDGDHATEPTAVWLESTTGLEVERAEVTVPPLEPGANHVLTWKATANPGPHFFGVRADGVWLGRGEVVCEEPRLEQEPLTLSHGDLRLTLPSQPFGYGTGILEWRDGDTWRQVGRLRSAGRLIYLDDAGHKRVALCYAQAYRQEEDGIHLVAEHTDVDGRRWTLTTSFSAAPGKPWFGLESTLTVDASAKLLAWSGPDYLPGEGSYATAKDSALFPGLEFLLGEEQSSGTDFFDASVADRYVPHPNKVTMPLMSVTHDGLATGITWDPLQTWAPGHERPAALYAVPNRWDHQDNHLMRLFAPGVTAGLEENRECLQVPMTMGPGEAQRLASQLFVVPATDELAALRLWLPDNGLAALPPKPFSYERSFELALQSYAETAWVPDAPGWHHAIHDPWGPGPDDVAALHLWWASLEEGMSAEQITRYREIAALGTRDATQVGGPTPWRYLPVLAMHMATSPSSVTMGKQLAQQNLLAQRADGGFVFAPDRSEPRAFGEAGDTSTGHTAAYAFPLLLGARLYGDRGLEAAGLRALEYLRAQPYRPEGAQTWELQLHVPDLLGSAWCVESFVEAYRLTGDPAHLEEAQRWALAGMPFIYQWSAPDRNLMAYGTIPVFGATRFSWPWIGRPVQWNGLAYAIALMDLDAVLAEASLAADLDWPQVAEGIVIATMQMQDAEGDFLGMYPDAWDVVIGAEAYSWWLNPTWHLQALLRVIGAEGIEPNTRIIDHQGSRIHVTSVGELQDVSIDANTLRIRLAYPAGEDTALMVSNLLLPERVLVDGVEASRSSRWEAGQPAWDWQQRLVPVLVPMQGPTAVVEIQLAP